MYPRGVFLKVAPSPLKRFHSVVLTPAVRKYKPFPLCKWNFPPNQATYSFSSVSSIFGHIWILSSTDLRQKRPQLGDPKVPSSMPTAK